MVSDARLSEHRRRSSQWLVSRRFSSRFSCHQASQAAAQLDVRDAQHPRVAGRLDAVVSRETPAIERQLVECLEENLVVVE
jgi:hypothetical protein